MKVPDWRKVEMVGGALAEPGAGEGRFLAWLPGKGEARARIWERVATVVGAEVVDEDGVCSVAATSHTFRQTTSGAVGKLAGRFFGKADDGAWSPPGGAQAERIGGRRTDLILAWANEEGVDLAALIQARWPSAVEAREVARGIFLVRGVPTTVEAGDPVTTPPEDSGFGPPSPSRAEAILDAARRSGDRKREAEALTDLGVILLQSGDPRRAAEALEQAFSILKALDDRSRDAEVSGQLGTALMRIGQVDRALPMLERSVSQAVSRGARYAEKLALERLGLAHVTRADPFSALTCFEGAIGLARALNDRGHEATLLWYASICLDRLGRRDEATSAADMAVDRMNAMGDPRSPWYADHLSRYRSEGSSGPLGGSPDSPLTAPSAPTGPGLLAMALSAGKAMATFLGSGLRTTPDDLRLARLSTCESCDHHTGLRCRLCGCFTSAKARMPHEACPIGKWPDQVAKV